MDRATLPRWSHAVGRLTRRRAGAALNALPTGIAATDRPSRQYADTVIARSLRPCRADRLALQPGSTMAGWRQPLRLPRLRCALLIPCGLALTAFAPPAGSSGSAARALAKDCRKPSIASVSVADLFGKLFGVGLLRGEQAAHGLQLVLHHLQLVDRFLLGRFQALGLFDQLFGRLRGARLQLPGRRPRDRFRARCRCRRATGRSSLLPARR